MPSLPPFARRTDMDFLRAASAFAVVLIHTAAPGQDSASLLYNALARFSVPVFFMVSGFFFLSRPASLSFPLKKSAVLLGKMLFWASVYSLADIAVFGRPYESMRAMLRIILIGPPHFWFLFALLALYALTPVLSVFCQNAPRRHLIYAMVGCFLLGSPLFLILRYEKVPIVSELVSLAKLNYTLGFVFCFLFGYWAKTCRPSTRIRKALYVAGLLGVCMTVWGVFSNRTEELFSFFAPNVLLYAMAVFILCLHVFRGKTHGRGLLFVMADGSFGIFVLHWLILAIYRRFAPPLPLPPVVSVPLVGAGVFVATLCLVRLLRKTPILRSLL